MDTEQKPDISAVTGTDSNGPGTAPQAPRLCRTLTLTDEPEETDAFGGPHQRIARAVTDLIQPLDAKGIAIGIEGSWGSGKSTVARLLIKQLESDDNIAVVSFDAWAHEGDPLRRTFLETIIRRLQNLEWVDKNLWDDRIDELANRREVVKTKDNITVTGWGKIIAFTLLLVPLGGAFVAAALDQPVTLYPGPLAWKFLIFFFLGLTLTFAPVFMFLLRINKDADILSLLFNRGPTEKTTETSKTINPTSIEFEDSFETLLKEAIEQNQRRVVFILDNLDRIDPKDALSIWSTLQTFFQHKGTSRPAWHERLWLLVLYDIRGLSQLWQHVANNGAKTKTALSFIDKSFQIRFEVPALVPSDWRDFLTNQLRKAFPDHSDPDLHQVYRVLAISQTKRAELPTIRELKLFANQIGSIHRQWAGEDGASDTFPLAHIACYVVLRRNDEDIIKELYNPNFPVKEYLDLLGSTVRDNLAGLAFNVETKIAQQLLFSDRIKSALTRGSSVDLTEVASLLGRGFWDAFERLATTEWAGTEASKMADAALALEESGLLKSAFNPSAQSVIRAICDRAFEVEAWAPMDENKAKGLAVLLKWKTELPSGPNQNATYVHKLFKAIALGLNEHVMRADLTRGASWLEYFKLIIQDLDPSLKQTAVRTAFDSLSDRLRGTDPVHSKQLEPVLEALSELQELPELSLTTGKTLKDLADEGQVREQLRQELVTSPGAVAWIVYVLMRYSTTFEKLPLRSENPEEREKSLDELFSESMVETFVGILERFKQTALLFQAEKARPDLDALVVRSLRFALKGPNAKEWVIAEDAGSRLEFVFAHLGGNDEEDAVLANLFSDVHQERDLVDELTAGDFKPLAADLYRLILQTGNGAQEKFVSWCLKGLRSIADDWRNYLFGRSRLLALAFHLTQMGVEVELGEKYFLALKNSIGQSVQLSVSAFVHDTGGNLAALIGPFDNQFRRAFRDYLYTIIRDKSDLPAWFFGFFGLELRTQLLHTSDTGAVQLLKLVAERRDRNGLEWLRDTLSTSGKSLESKYSTQTAWMEFKQAVRRALITERYKIDTNALVKSIASILNVTSPQNGQIAFATADATAICGLDPKTLETNILIQEPFAGYTVVSDPSWSPDGKKLAYTAATTPSGTSEILIFDPSLGGNNPVTDDSKRIQQPRWAPDGQMLAFVRTDELYGDIFTINLKTNMTRKLTEGMDINEWPNWSPDGTQLVFHRFHDGSTRVFVMSADGSNDQVITPGPKDFDPAWSPDGRQIAFASLNKLVDKSGIYVVNPDGTELSQLIQENDARAPTWSPDGTKLLFQVGHGPEARICQVDSNGENKKELAKGVGPTWQPLLNDDREAVTLP